MLVEREESESLLFFLMLPFEFSSDENMCRAAPSKVFSKQLWNRPNLRSAVKRASSAAPLGSALGKWPLPANS